MPEIVIKREPASPLALMVSMGGTKEIGYYMVWRGDNPIAVLSMIRDVLKAAEEELPKLRRPMG